MIYLNLPLIIISNMSQQQKEILALCQEINQALEIHIDKFSIRQLAVKGWYLEVLEILYPYLSDKLNQIAKIQKDQTAIDRMLLLLTEQEIIEEDFLEIKGDDLVKGDIDSIYYVVQLLSALVKRALDGEEEEDEDQNAQGQNDEEEEEEQLQGNQNEQSAIPEQKNRNAQQFRQKEHHSDDEKSNRECHSVLGINHQFDQSDQPEEVYQASQNQQRIHPFQNILPQPKQHSNQQFYSKNQPESDSEEFQGQYLNQKLKKHQSQNQIKNITSIKKNKNINHENQTQKKTLGQQGTTIKKQQKKSSNLQSHKLTKEIKKKLKETRSKQMERTKKQNRSPQLTGFAKEQIKRKGKQFRYATKQYEKDKIRAKISKNQANHTQNSSNKQEKNLLNWREAKLKRQKKQFEEDMEMKLQNKRELYIKKINRLILAMEKQKYIEERKDFREKLLRDNQKATKKMIAIENQYKTRYHLIQEKKSSKIQEEKLMRTGHQQIIKQLERELKIENEKKMISMTMKYRQKEAEIEDDLEQLTQKIVQVYKKN